MSIIQDALKKVGKNAQDSDLIKNVIEKGEIRASGRRKVTTTVLVVLAIAGLLLLGFRFFNKLPSGARDVSYKVAPESTIYKPVLSASIAQSAKIDASAAPSKPGRRSIKYFPDFILSGVMQLVDGPKAIINDVIVGVGDTISGATVRQIDKEEVVLKKDGSDITLKLK